MEKNRNELKRERHTIITKRATRYLTFKARIFDWIRLLSNFILKKIILDAEKPLPPGKPGPNSGQPGIDYPNYSVIPETAFSCKQQRYKGFFGDPETNCQVWHYCDLNGGKASFLCPNGTIFSQVALTCDWWFNVKCANTAQQYVLNERLYKYILPFTPKFPEDYSGPLVDK